MNANLDAAEDAGRASTLYTSHLGANDIFAIKSAFTAGDDAEEIAAAYEISVRLVYDIVRPSKVFVPAGEGHHSAKLSTAEVLEIRKQCATGKTYAEVGTAFGIGADYVCRINLRQLWQHLPPAEDAPEPRRNVILSPVQILKVRKRYTSGEKVGALAKAYGVHHSTISLIVHRKSHANVK